MTAAWRTGAPARLLRRISRALAQLDRADRHVIDRQMENALDTHFSQSHSQDAQQHSAPGSSGAAAA